MININREQMSLEEVCRDLWNDELEECFDLMRDLELKDFAVFGGAVRDSIINLVHGKDIKVNDYDIRVVVPETDYMDHVDDIREEIRCNERVRELEELHIYKPSRQRIGVILRSGVELDLSFEGIDDLDDPDYVAEKRVKSGDVGISSVAISADKRLFYSDKFLSDLKNQTVSIDNDEMHRLHPLRVEQYALKVANKLGFKVSNDDSA